MDFIMLVGFFAIIFSIIYLVYHFLRRMKDKERRLSRKIFFPTLIGGFLLFSISIAFLDTGAQAKLDEALEQNNTLTANISDLESENQKLKKQITGLESEIKNTSSEITEYEEELKLIEEEKTVFTTEKESLNKQIEELTAKNTELQTKVDHLNSQLASSKPSSTASTPSGNSSSSSSLTTSSNGGVESYKNCTELRKVYPGGVGSGHPAYASKHDRDKDGWACE